MKRAKKISLALSIVLIFCALLAGCSSDQENDQTVGVELPVINSGKQPSQYTWEEYLAMDEKQKLEFQKKFGSVEVFEAWMEKAQRGEVDTSFDNAEDVENVDVPWDEGGAKQPAEYTWAEFEALTAAQQMVFQNSFDSIDDFDTWLQEAQFQAVLDEIEIPWENGGKQPEEYTWEEFEALDATLQMLFQKAFESPDAFDAWLQKSQPQETQPHLDLPWEQGGKEPSQYTWAEFEALTAEQQMAFQNSFGSIDEFDAWMKKAQGGSESYPWEKPGAKQPDQYTWAEFEALTAEEQIAFQNSFASFEEFDAWMLLAQGGNTQMPWENGGKPPEEYTWAEFEALSAEEQMRFQSSFSTPDGFERWLDKNMP